MTTSRLALGVAALAALSLAGCNRGSSSSGSASVAPGSQIQPSPSPSPAVSPSPSPSPAPSPSPSPSPSGGWLHVASSPAGGGATTTTTETITTFAIDPTTGAPSSPVDTALPAGFGVSGIAADASASLLFVTGGGDTRMSVQPGKVLPIQVAAGTLALGTVFDMGSVHMSNVVPLSPATDAAHGTLFCASMLQTSPSGPVTGGPVVSFAYDPTGALTLLQPATPPTFAPPANGALASFAIDPAGDFVYGPLQWSAAAGEVGAFSSASGVLTPVAGSPYSVGSPTAGVGAQLALVRPGGAFVFTGNSDGSITTFAASAGALSAPQTVVAAAGSNLGGLACDPAGRFLFASCGVPGTVVAFTVDPATGALTPAGTPATFTDYVGALAVDPAGLAVYVALTPAAANGAGGVGVLGIGATGALTPLASAKVALPSGGVPMGLVVTR